MSDIVSVSDSLYPQAAYSSSLSESTIPLSDSVNVIGGHLQYYESETEMDAVSVSDEVVVTSYRRITKDFVHRLSGPRKLSKDVLHRLSGPRQQSKDIVHRVSNNRLTKDILHRMAVGRHLQKDVVHRLFSAPAEVAVPSAWWSAPPLAGSPGHTSAPEYELAWRTGRLVNEPTYSSRVWTPSHTYDLGEAPNGVQVTHNESGAIRWQLSIEDVNGDYHPRKKGGPYEGVMNSRAYDGDDNFAKKFLFHANYGGADYHIVGIPTDYGHTRRWQNGPIDFNWGGIDISERWFRRAQTSATIRTSRNGATWTNVEAILDICTQLKMACDLSRLRTELIRVQHRQDGRWGDWAQALFDMTNARWIVEGETLVVYQPVYSGPATWRYTKGSLLLEDNLEGQKPQIVNKITGRRANEGGKVAGTVLRMDKFGEYQLSLPPTDGLDWYTPPAQLGIVSDLVFRKNGDVIAVRNVRSGGTWPSFLTNNGPIHGADHVTLTWGAPPSVSVTGDPGYVRFFGASEDGGETATDKTYTVGLKETTSILGSGTDHGYGELPKEMPPNPLFYDSAQVERWGRSYLVENSHDLLPQTFRAHLNHRMRPGDRVEIYDETLNLEEIRHVRQCTHSFNDDPGQRFTRFLTWLYPNPADLNIVKV